MLGRDCFKTVLGLFFGSLLFLQFISIPVSAITSQESGSTWNQQVNANRMLADIEMLASNPFQGRYAGTAGDKLTQDYLNDQLDNLSSVIPLTSRNDFKQLFDITPWSVAINPVNLTIAGKTLVYGQDYIDLTFSGNSSVFTPAEIVFAGYSISTDGYDDYGTLNVAGKIVVACRGTPSGISYEYGYYGVKAEAAYSHGASGLIVVLHPNSGSDSFRKGTLTPGYFIPGMGTLSAKRSSLESLNLNITEWINDLDSSLSSSSSYQGSKSRTTGIFATMQVTAHYEEEVESANVLGKFQGATNGNSERAIIISAHHDHQGQTLTGDTYPGADDDASGVAVTLEVARVLDYLYQKYEFRRSIIIAFWGAEEIGLLGARHFASNESLFPLGQTDLVLQLDMVGLGPVDGTLVIDEGQYFPDVVETVERAALKHGSVNSVAVGNGGSDHLAFLEKGVPGVCFFWDDISTHPDYHTPLDTADLIDPVILEKVALTTVGYLFESGAIVEDTTSTVNLIEAVIIITTIGVVVIYVIWFIKKK
ncbi:MAG: M28 family peptidase [Candidatus Odinarchaeota archaeon]